MRALSLAAFVSLAACDAVFGLTRVDPPPDAPTKPTGTWQEVAAGSDHACAIDSDRQLWCWGRNDYGQLGVPDVAEAQHPVHVEGARWTAIAANYLHTCGLRDDGSLWCWGFNYLGALGLENVAVYQHVTSPQQVTGRWRSVALGFAHSCAITDTGSAACWGANNYGDLGTTTSDANPHLVPERVVDPGPWKAIAAGRFATCGIKEDGTLWCWGSADNGESGITPPINHAIPTRVDENHYLAVGIGSGFMCAIRDDHRLLCTGYNGEGQLGNDDVNTRLTLSPVAGEATWEDLAVGPAHACGRQTDGTLACWGSHRYDQLGEDLEPVTFRSIPIAIDRDIARVAVGDASTCAIAASNGALWCTGRHGRSVVEPQRVIVPSPNRSLSLALGGEESCALDGVELRCWGDNQQGSIGDGTTFDRQAPVVVPPPADSPFVQVAVGSLYTCAIDGSDTTFGNLYCWGYDGQGQLGDGDVQRASKLRPTLVYGSTAGTYLRVSALSHTCALGATTSCWGANTYGQLGPNATVGTDSDKPVGTGGVWSSIATGGAFTCGIDATNTVQCAGDNMYGELGDASRVSRKDFMPTLVPSGASSVVAGWYFACALGPISYCWGDGTHGQLGNGERATSPSPQEVPGSWTTLTAGGAHACGIDPAHQLWCWGANEHGQLGDGTFEDRASPVRVGTGTWSSVVAGGQHTCAVADDGSVWCWGANARGQVGTSSAWTTAHEKVE